jgi:hypothetical protein
MQKASPSPRQGDIVAPITTRVSSLSQRNAPVGILIDAPEVIYTTSS